MSEDNGDNGGFDDRKRKIAKGHGERLTLLRKKSGFRSSDAAYDYLAREGLKITVHTYKAYEQGKRILPQWTAEEILKAYNNPDATIEWLLTGANKPEWGPEVSTVFAVPPKILRVPLLTPREAALMPAGYVKLSETRELHGIAATPDQEIGPRSFLLRITDDSMVPSSPFEVDRFFEGDFVLIDPDADYEPGDYVCALLEGEDETIFRKYREADRRSDKDKCFGLVPLNNSYATEEVGPDNPGQIKGRMIRYMRNY